MKTLGLSSLEMKLCKNILVKAPPRAAEAHSCSWSCGAPGEHGHPRLDVKGVPEPQILSIHWWVGETLNTRLPDLQVWQINREVDCSEGCRRWEVCGVVFIGWEGDGIVSAVCLGSLRGDAPGPCPSFEGGLGHVRPNMGVLEVRAAVF